MSCVLVRSPASDVYDALPEQQVDSVVTVAPEGVAWAKVKRACKPGAMVVAFCHSDRYYATACDIEDAGFEIRDAVMWLHSFGTFIIALARKPLDGTVAANVVKHGTGALNIDACRIAHGDDVDLGAVQRQQHSEGSIVGAFGAASLIGKEIATYKPEGRWPANLVLSHAPDCRKVGTKKVKAAAPASGPSLTGESTSASRGKFNGVAATAHHGDENGEETVPAWSCVPECPCARMDESGNVSRFFYIGDDMIRYAIALTTRPGGLILDPSSGDALVASVATGMGHDFIGLGAKTILHNAQVLG